MCRLKCIGNEVYRSFFPSCAFWHFCFTGQDTVSDSTQIRLQISFKVHRHFLTFTSLNAGHTDYGWVYLVFSF